MINLLRNSCGKSCGFVNWRAQARSNQCFYYKIAVDFCLERRRLNYEFANDEIAVAKRDNLKFWSFEKMALKFGSFWTREKNISSFQIIDYEVHNYETGSTERACMNMAVLESFCNWGFFWYIVLLVHSAWSDERQNLVHVILYTALMTDFNGLYIIDIGAISYSKHDQQKTRSLWQTHRTLLRTTSKNDPLIFLGPGFFIFIILVIHAYASHLFTTERLRAPNADEVWRWLPTIPSWFGKSYTDSFN